jgi:hypothetical protein
MVRVINAARWLRPPILWRSHPGDLLEASAIALELGL